MISKEFKTAYTEALFKIILDDTTKVEDLGPGRGWKYTTQDGIIVSMNEKCDLSLIMNPGKWEVSEMVLKDDLEYEITGISQEDFIRFVSEL